MAAGRASDEPEEGRSLRLSGGGRRRGHGRSQGFARRGIYGPPSRSGMKENRIAEEKIRIFLLLPPSSVKGERFETKNEILPRDQFYTPPFT